MTIAPQLPNDFLIGISGNIRQGSARGIFHRFLGRDVPDLEAAKTLMRALYLDPATIRTSRDMLAKEGATMDAATLGGLRMLGVEPTAAAIHAMMTAAMRNDGTGRGTTTLRIFPDQHVIPYTVHATYEHVTGIVPYGPGGVVWNTEGACPRVSIPFDLLPATMTTALGRRGPDRVTDLLKLPFDIVDGGPVTGAETTATAYVLQLAEGCVPQVPF